MSLGKGSRVDYFENRILIIKIKWIGYTFRVKADTLDL